MLVLSTQLRHLVRLRVRHLVTLAIIVELCGATTPRRIVAAELSPQDAKLVGQMAAEAALKFAASGHLTRRDEKLQQALARDADCELAHWHLGHLRYENQWLPVADVEAMLRDDVTYQTYLNRRDTLNGDAKQELRLADWCRAQNMEELARFHYDQVIQHATSSPKQRREAFESLGLHAHQGEWLTEEEMQSRRDQAAAEQAATKQWDRPVGRWLKMIARDDPRQLDVVRTQMSEMKDIAVIPLLETRMSSHSEPAALEVVRWLASQPNHAATESLLSHATELPWPQVRLDATKALAERPVHDVVPPLLGQLVAPIESRFAVCVSPFGMVLHQHEIFRAGRDANELARHSQLDSAIRPGSQLAADRPGWPGRGRISRFALADTTTEISGGSPTREEHLNEMAEVRARTELLALKAALRTAAIEQNVAAVNQNIRRYNERFYPILKAVSHADLPDHPEAWWDWWETYNEQYSPPKSTRYFYDCDVKYYGSTYLTAFRRSSCFVEGTPVRTDQGWRAIETVQPGHRVLSQDPNSGELSYRVVQARTERPAADLLQIEIEGDTLLATKGHPFWVLGKGWRMAKRLDVGDRLHTLEGPKAIQAITPQNALPAYNLVIRDGDSYFVGKSSVLVHDNKPRQPTRAVVPGLINDAF